MKKVLVPCRWDGDKLVLDDADNSDLVIGELNEFRLNQFNFDMGLDRESATQVNTIGHASARADVEKELGCIDAGAVEQLKEDARLFIEWQESDDSDKWLAAQDGVHDHALDFFLGRFRRSLALLPVKEGE